MLSHPNRVSNFFCFTTKLYHCVRLAYGIPFYDVSLQRGVSLTITASYIGVSPYLDVSPQKEYPLLITSTHKVGIPLFDEIPHYHDVSPQRGYPPFRGVDPIEMEGASNSGLPFSLVCV